METVLMSTFIMEEFTLLKKCRETLTKQAIFYLAHHYRSIIEYMGCDSVLLECHNLCKEKHFISKLLPLKHYALIICLNYVYEHLFLIVH